MDVICCCCIEFKSKNSCASINKVSKDLVLKYCVQSSITLNYDGHFYVCKSCKQCIVKDTLPKRCQKEVLGLLDFPKAFYDSLESICVPFNKKMREDPEKKYLQLNRLEDFLLKPVIPFIRIAHLPRGRYVQLKGDLIMISANIPESLTRILPVNQQLVPVALKRKLEYKGHFLYEYVDKDKLLHYFMFLKQHNHIFENIELDMNLVQIFEKKTMDYVEKIDSKKDTHVKTPEQSETYEKYTDDFDSDEDDMKEECLIIETVQTADDEIKCETKVEEKITNDNDNDLNEDEFISRCSSSSLITNKYRENTNSITVANKLSDCIIAFEQSVNKEDEKRLPVENDYLEDEIFQSDDEEELEIPEELSEKEDESNRILFMKKITKRAMNQLNDETANFCKCQVEKNLALVIHYSFELDQMCANTEQESNLKEVLKDEFKTCISNGRNSLKLYEANCNHPYNRVMADVENIMESNIGSTQFVEDQKQLIKEKIAKVSVAPSECGEWKNWHSEVFLEEKLFPSLYPYGYGGYLSSNLLKASNIGISNYIKSRIMCADPKFRNDTNFVFFWLLVKELTDIKRSEQTFLRKSSKSPNLTSNVINDIGKENLIRFNSAYTAYKNLRGTSMYYQDKKKELMATLRQKGAPTLFTTFSCAEYEWDHLIQSIYKTVYKQNISIEDVKKLPSSFKSKLVGENVVQSTTHFSKRTSKLMSLMTAGGFFLHNGIDYKVDSYFYRVEFQARGAPHIHCLIWLRDEKGNCPPTLWNESKKSPGDLCKSIASFGGAIMSGTADDMHCDSHEALDDNCTECSIGKSLVEKYQSHKHGFSCKKKGKKIRILAGEGHGRLDNKKVSEELLVDVCRLRHPKYPIDNCEFILAFPSDTDEKLLKRAKVDYQKIRKYLLRLTHGENYQEKEEWKQFKLFTFQEFLKEVGMYESDEDTDFERAKERYITALRCEVKNSGLLLLKRGTRDIFTNNYNKYLIRIHQANQDIQFVTDEYAVAQYILNYLLKNESGVSALLRQIDEEATRDGEPTLTTIKKLGKVLDKGREMSIQEAIYRALGLPMTKFSDVVRFVDTSHPHKREGLLKTNFTEIDEGEKIFHNSYHDYYEIRPCDTDNSSYWNDLCLADFVSEYSIDYTRNQKNFQLQDGKSFISKRRRQCVLRYFLKYDSEEELCRALCILFLPFRNEMIDLHSKDPICLYEENMEIVEMNRNKYEKHKVLVDKIRLK